VINDTAGTVLRSFTFTTYTADPTKWLMRLYFEKAVQVATFTCADFQLQNQRAAAPANVTQLTKASVSRRQEHRLPRRELRCLIRVSSLRTPFLAPVTSSALSPRNSR